MKGDSHPDDKKLVWQFVFTMAGQALRDEGFERVRPTLFGDTLRARFREVRGFVGPSFAWIADHGNP